MRVFLTGGTGFVGQHLAKRIGEEAELLVCLRRDVLDNTMPYWNVLSQGDLSDHRNLARIMSEYEIDTVYHLAAQCQVSTAVKDPLSTFETNVRGTWNVLEAARLARVRNVIVASTDKQYGRTPPPYDELTHATPDRPYETSKACADLIARTYAATYGMSVAVVRCVNIYGPGQRNFSTLIPRTIKRIMDGQRPVIRNGGRMKRDWLYIDDAVDAYMMLADQLSVGPICFGTGVPTSISEIVGRILKQMGSNLEPLDEADPHGEIAEQWSTYYHAKKVLGWSPKVGIGEGLARTVEWYKEALSARPA